MIRIFGYGVTTKPLVRFLNSLGIRVAIYDDTFEGTRSDDFGNTLLDSALFSDDGTPTPIVSLTQDSLQTCDISIISPGIPPTHMLVRKARNLIGEYDFFYFLCSIGRFHQKACGLVALMARQPLHR